MSTSFLAYTEAQTRQRDTERTSRTQSARVPAVRRRHRMAERLRRVADALDS